jgi:hypothetical protein
MINASGINKTGINAAAGPAAPSDNLFAKSLQAGPQVSSPVYDQTPGENVRESARVYGTANTATEIDLIRDSAIVTGNHTVPLSRGLVVRVTASITDSVIDLRTTLPTVRDGVVGTDYTYQATIRTEDVLDSAVVTGDVESLTPSLDLVDAALVTSSASYNITARYIVRDAARISSQPSFAGALVVRDSFVGTSTSYEARTARYVVRDTSLITGTDANDLPQDLLVDVLETAVVLGYATNRLTARLDVHDAAYATDSMDSRDGLEGTDGLPADTVWTTNISSWGMSRHSGTGITQRGTRFAVSPAGLYELGEGYASAAVDTGYLNFGSKALKHVSTVYLEGERAGDLVLTVTADRNGTRASNSYIPIARDHIDSRSVRIDIGRGYRSTYYKLHIQTVGQAELFGGRLLVANTQRRI